MSVWKLGSLLFGSSGGAPALGRCEDDLGAGIFEDIIGRRQFLQPEAGLTASIAELVVRGQNHQDLHKLLPSAWGTSFGGVRRGMVKSWYYRASANASVASLATVARASAIA